MPRHSPYALIRLNFPISNSFELLGSLRSLELLEFHKTFFRLFPLCSLKRLFSFCALISFFHLSVKLYFTLLFNRKTYTNLLIFVLFVCSFFLLFNLSSFIRFSMITRLNFTLVKLNQNNFCQTSSFLALWRTKLFVCLPTLRWFGWHKWTRTTDLALIRRAL